MMQDLNAGGLRDRGRERYAAGDIDGALADYSKAIEIGRASCRERVFRVV